MGKIMPIGSLGGRDVWKICSSCGNSVYAELSMASSHLCLPVDKWLSGRL